MREIKGLGVGVRDFLGVAATIFTLSGCTVEGALVEYLSEVFPSGSKIEITESCGGSLGLSAAVAVLEVSFPEEFPTQDLTAFDSERGEWTRQASLREFVEKDDFEVRTAATVLDGKDCLRDLRDDADALLFEPKPGLYFRSNDQTVVIMMPDDEVGTAVLLAQGR